MNDCFFLWTTQQMNLLLLCFALMKNNDFIVSKLKLYCVDDTEAVRSR